MKSLNINKINKFYITMLWLLILISPFIIIVLNQILKYSHIKTTENQNNPTIIGTNKNISKTINIPQPSLDDNINCPVKKSDIVVDDSYFDDVVFVGDSITSGLKLYKTVKNAVIISETGLNIETIANHKINIDDQQISVLDAIKQLNRKKLYIMIGSNGIGWLENDYMLKLFNEWLRNLKSDIPDISIYVQSVLPITKELSDFNQSKPNKLTNQKIDDYNNALLGMCKNNQYYFLNVAEIFKDSENALIKEASPVDGMHINSTYYNNWIDYIKTHTVSQ